MQALHQSRESSVPGDSRREGESRTARGELRNTRLDGDRVGDEDERRPRKERPGIRNVTEKSDRQGVIRLVKWCILEDKDLG
ncbi:hypothetical protein VTN00DRAFT_1500 [Thermoascus crustaceus]|uniref:uncharacterized protein n=1 Tax=Thermoascus crustaceus TaxID=5088 RepID=UPI00374317DD